MLKLTKYIKLDCIDSLLQLQKMILKVWVLCLINRVLTIQVTKHVISNCLIQ